MNYEEAIAYIKETAAFGTNLGLDNIRSLMSLLDNPQEKLKFIHIAGTNGKGSVAAYILSVLEQAGLRTGFYTSPELYRFSERIRINEEEISKDDIAKYVNKVHSAAEYMTAHNMGSPSEFELVLAMAFCYFLDKKVDIVVLEVGLGGRLDATNVIRSSILSVITKISFDHMQYLGNTLSEIASEKAAIIKEHGTVIVYPSDEEITEIYRKICRKKKARFYEAALPSSRSMMTGEKGSFCSGQEFTLYGKNYITGMIGAYETENAALAIQAMWLIKNSPEMKDYIITDENIYEGIRDAFWPGRFEIMSDDPLIILDGAHNEDGAKALASSIKEYLMGRRIVLCIGILKDKQYDKMLAELLPFAETVIACKVPNPRSLKADDLSDMIRRGEPGIRIETAENPEQALAEIKKLQSDTAAIIICGSLYLVGPMRELIIKDKLKIRTKSSS